MPTLHFTLATQNPVEFEATFPPIEVQKDRFAYSLRLDHLDAGDELELIRRSHTKTLGLARGAAPVAPIVTAGEIATAQTNIRDLYADESILAYIRDIIMATRDHADVRLGASSRGSIALLIGAKAYAAINDRGYVIPDDVKAMAVHVLRHRMILRKEAETGGITAEGHNQGKPDMIEVP